MLMRNETESPQQLSSLILLTEKSINPGNSGGALVDVNGHLMGINTAIYSRSGGSMGIGFAIPISTAKQVMQDLLQNGKVVRGWIGVEPQDMSPELAESFQLPKVNSDQSRHGVVITGVLQNGPAAKAGVRPGDVILQVAKSRALVALSLVGMHATLLAVEDIHTHVADWAQTARARCRS